MSVHTSKKQLSAPLQTIALLTDAILNDMTAVSYTHLVQREFQVLQVAQG